MSDERTIDEIEDRLAELETEAEQARELGEAFAAARSALDDARRNPLVDDAGVAQIKTVVTVLNSIQHHDINPSERIYWERHHLRDKRVEKRVGVEGDDE